MAYTPRPKREVTCETCGKVAHTHAHNWRFCSQKCKDDHWNKSLSCAQCGAAMWKGGRRVSEEVVTCRKCRAERVEHGKVGTYKLRGCRCDLCVEAFRAAARKNDAARRARTGKQVRQCVACGVAFNPRANQTLCSPECRKAQLGRYGSHRSRAAFWGVDFETIDRAEVFERDGWTCGICTLPVDPTAKFPDAGAATLDHIVPMSRGGDHVKGNVQLAHFHCNSSKGAREQEATAC